MAKQGYKVCWWFKSRSRPTCRTLSAVQHASAQEAAETVLMQNPSAIVQVISPRGGGRGTLWRLNRKLYKAGMVHAQSARR